MLGTLLYGVEFQQGDEDHQSQAKSLLEQMPVTVQKNQRWIGMPASVLGTAALGLWPWVVCKTSCTAFSQGNLLSE